MANKGYEKVETRDNPTPIMDSNSGLPSTHSSQQLMPTDSESVTTSLDDETSSRRPRDSSPGLFGISARNWFTVGVLCFVNLINYMDRFTIAGVLSDIQRDFNNISDAKAGLLQTAFVLSYMICAPVFGFLGDRHSRRWIMIFGIALWSATTLIGSFMKEYGWFLTFRALVGVGEASYSTIAPTIISDLFVSDVRSKMLALFYFAIPVGSGLGYIVGSETAKAFGAWQWALRVTPILGAIAVVLIFMTREPERGQAEGSHMLESTSYCEDVKAITKNRSFMLSTAGFTCVAFVAGALAWWGPSFIHLGMSLQPGNENLTLNEVSYRFGIIAMSAGLIGVPLGSYLAQRFRPTVPKIDPQICALGLFISAPFVYLAIVVAPTNGNWCYTFVFLAQVALNLTWSIVADILLVRVPEQQKKVSFVFGALTMVSGLIGVPLGSYLSQTLIKKHPRIDPILCAIGLIVSAPFLAGAILLVSANSVAAYILVFLGEVALNMNWAIVADILLYVVVPTRRSTAEALQILISHAFGDSSSPYLVGVISDAIKAVLSETKEALAPALTGQLESLSLLADNSTAVTAATTTNFLQENAEIKFKGLQYALFTTCFVEILGGIFFLCTAIYILRDKQKAEKAVKDSQVVEETYADGDKTEADEEISEALKT